MTDPPALGSPNGHDDLLSLAFDTEHLAAVRHSAERTARTAGLPERSLDGFVLAVSEVATNAIIHGGGRGKLRLWIDGDRLHCRISDRGPGIGDDKLSSSPPPVTAVSGRGLWLVRQLCEVEISGGDNGTTVELSVPKTVSEPDESATGDET